MPNPYCEFGGEPIESPDGESLEGVSETRLTTGTIFTDKLFTGQREMRRPDWRSRVEGAGLGIYHYHARFLRSAPEAGGGRIHRSWDDSIERPGGRPWLVGVR